MKKAIACVLCAAALALSAHVNAQEEVAEPAGHHDMVRMNITVGVGFRASFALPSNPSTGYCWMLAEELPEDAPVQVGIKPVEANTKDKETGQPLCGAPSETEISFKGLHEGKTTVKLIYARPWEKDTPPCESITVNVEVVK